MRARCLGLSFFISARNYTQVACDRPKEIKCKKQNKGHGISVLYNLNPKMTAKVQAKDP